MFDSYKINVNVYVSEKDSFNKKLDQIMADIKEIKAKVVELQSALDAEQQQVADLLAANQEAIATLQETVDRLNVMLADGGTVAERQEIVELLNQTKADLENTVTSTESEQPQEEDQEDEDEDETPQPQNPGSNEVL
jgi:chromosome segregation ATPase